MKLQVFAASAHRKWNYSLWSLLHSCTIHFCCLCQQLYQQNLLILPLAQRHHKLHVPCRYTKPTQKTSVNVQKSLSHSFLYWLQFFSWQQGQKGIAKPASKQLSLEGLGREQGVSSLLCSGVPVMPLHFSLGWLSNKITFLFFAPPFGWKDALMWDCCSKKQEGHVVAFQLHAVCLHHHSSFLQPPLSLWPLQALLQNSDPCFFTF